MAIDLNSLSSSLAGNRVRTSGQTSEKNEVSKNEAHSAASQTSTKSDSVQLSDEALRLNSRAQSAPDIDESKVNAIQSSIEDGTYKIDYQALAKSIIQFENKL
ncbi:flagellar biosynthesis anti-sigma factor FlgM [Oceanospirillum linum]|uniref:flagellar biosynthesis anti-sigma factor FlgM n=1 Tax=Oceanospirillum linum TaxID=966 RepID=UPI00089E9777|nr:flagellar biosynthesis anti-sigma factor FlgM [Oceanospirillum linum]SEF58778.1 anti-sigma-28 factor, FlgM family [Oleiphilus messinensis]SMP06533.1 anti-sigma-28 factor, FlgM family [Oceanospirillum linum]